MSDVLPLDGPGFAPSSGGAPGQLVILLHGIGADGNDLIGLARRWAEFLPHAEFLSPHAPFPCEMAPAGRQWFGLTDLNPEAVLEGARRCAPILDAFLDTELEKRDLSDDRLALVGFSQGTMMSLFVGLRRKKPCAAILGYSGMLVGPETLESEIAARPPVMLVHGDADLVMPVLFLPAAGETLRRCAVSVEIHVRPGLGHGIDEEGIALGGRFLEKALRD